MILLQLLIPSLILMVTALVLVFFGCSRSVNARRATPIIAGCALLAVIIYRIFAPSGPAMDPYFQSVAAGPFSAYIEVIVAFIGLLIVLLSWPTNADATGNSSLDLQRDAGEFFGLLLFALSGVMLVAVANDLILLFLAIELASVPTYIMVALSRPLPAAQEAGIKYFFLGALSAAVMLFGLSYIYGTTGELSLPAIAAMLQGDALTPLEILGIVMVLLGLAFKIAAVPLHFYAGDVYQGAATPVTAMLAFVPKAVGFIAILKVLHMVGGDTYAVGEHITKLMWAISLLTMTMGNVLGLMPYNVKRVLAYSSIAHSGYMLVPVAAMCSAGTAGLANASLIAEVGTQAILFYIVIYGVMSVASFGALMMLPSRQDQPATSAETYDDLAGAGRSNPAVGLMMAISCFALIGLPLTSGFFGKLGLLVPAWKAGMTWLVIVAVVNAAISAGYYLRIVAAMFLAKPVGTVVGELGVSSCPPNQCQKSLPVMLSVAIASVATVGLGIILPATNAMQATARQATQGVTPGIQQTLPADTDPASTTE